MEEKHFFTPRCLSVEEVRNAAEQQSQVINKSKVAHDSQDRHKQEETTPQPLQQTIQPLIQYGTTGGYVVKSYSMTFDKLKVAYTYYTNKAKPFEVVDWEQFSRRYTKSGGCYYEYRHPKIDLYIRFGLKENDGEAWELIL